MIDSNWGEWVQKFMPKSMLLGDDIEKEVDKIYEELNTEVEKMKGDSIKQIGWKIEKTLLDKLKSKDKNEVAQIIYDNFETLRVRLDGLEKQQKGIITYIHDRMEKNKIIDKGLTVSKLVVEYEDGKQITLDKDFFETVYSSRNNKFNNIMK